MDLVCFVLAILYLCGYNCGKLLAIFVIIYVSFHLLDAAVTGFKDGIEKKEGK